MTTRWCMSTRPSHAQRAGPPPRWSGATAGCCRAATPTGRPSGGSGERRRHLVVTLLNQRKDGTPFWDELSLSPVRDSEGIRTDVVGIRADVTARVVAEQERGRALEAERSARSAAELVDDSGGHVDPARAGLRKRAQGPAADRKYDEDDLSLAADLGRRAALTVDSARLYEREHDVAEALQRSLLRRLPQVPGLGCADSCPPSSTAADADAETVCDELLAAPDATGRDDVALPVVRVL